MTKHLIVGLALGLVMSSAATGAQRAMRFADMDVNDDGVITRKEWRGNPRAFDDQDWNADGILSGNEVRPGARRPTPNQDTARESDDYSDWSARGFAALDTDRDGRIGREEWHFAIDGFRRADRNRDGWLSRAEFLGEEDDQPSADLRGPFADTNGDGRISRSEWRGTAERFNTLDANRDGQLTRAEVRGAPAAQTEAWRLGRERGLVEGRSAGREDREHNRLWDLDGQRELQNADSGYEQRFGARSDYQAGYRDGFRQGYREGWGPR